MRCQFFAADFLVDALAQKREPWKRDHVRVMQKYDKAECLGEIVALLLYGISRLDNSSASPERRENVQWITLSWADNLCASHSKWYNFAAEILADVEEIEQEGFGVNGSDDLRAALQRVGQMLPEMSKVRQQIADFRAGKCVKLKDAVDAMGCLPSPGCS